MTPSSVMLASASLRPADIKYMRQHMSNMPSSFSLVTTGQFKPIEQGRLDYLCGLYATINAVRLIKPATARQSQTMFEMGVRYLDDRGWLSTVLTEGMPIRLFSSLARHLLRASGHEITRLVAFPTRTTKPIGSNPDELAILSAVAQGRPVIVALDGPLDHYSVIHGYSPQRFHLFDSFGYRWLNRKDCGYGRQPNKRHRITPWLIPAPKTQTSPQNALHSYAA